MRGSTLEKQNKKIQRTRKLAADFGVKFFMVIFILTKEGFNEMEPFVKTGEHPIWLNGGVLCQAEIDLLISEDIEVSYFNYVVDIGDEEALAEAIFSVAEHHPGERIWSESKPQI